MEVLSISRSDKRLPVVQLLTMGGTIAGVASSATSASYQSAAQCGDALLAAVPGLDQRAELRVQDVVAKDSADLVLEDWWMLYQAICLATADCSVDAVVITHGTDTLEETAFFLDLLLATNKPVILVGAMRPATALSADGPLNLFNAVAVAVHPASVGRGVLVVMNDHIMTAREVCKSHTTAVQAFTSPHRGGMGAGVGTVYLGEVRYASDCPVRSRSRPELLSDWAALPDVSRWPRVDIVYMHAGMSLPASWVSDVHRTAPDKLEGLVLAGTGAGNIPSYLHSAICALRDQGVVVVRSTRVWAGGVISDYQGLDGKMDLISANDLSPHKARILLMLLLCVSRDIGEIRRCFDAASG